MCRALFFFQPFNCARMCHKSYEFLWKYENVSTCFCVPLSIFAFNVFYGMSVFIFISTTNLPITKESTITICTCVSEICKSFSSILCLGENFAPFLCSVLLINWLWPLISPFFIFSATVRLFMFTHRQNAIQRNAILMQRIMLASECCLRGREGKKRWTVEEWS